MPRYKQFLATLYHGVSEVAPGTCASGKRKKKGAAPMRRWRKIKHVVSMQQQGSGDGDATATANDNDDDDDDDERALFADHRSPAPLIAGPATGRDAASVAPPSPVVWPLGGDQGGADAVSSGETTGANEESMDATGAAAASADYGDRDRSPDSGGGPRKKTSDGRDAERGDVAAGGEARGGAQEPGAVRRARGRVARSAASRLSSSSSSDSSPLTSLDLERSANALRAARDAARAESRSATIACS